MAYTTIIPPDELLTHLRDADWIVIDCRFSLDRTERGREDYLTSHIPGAIYAHLDEDLSGPIVPGRTGRHPLPAVEVLTDTFSRWGITDGVQVVAYDDAGGSIAARLWWLLRWLGHNAVAVLDGGWPAWRRAGYPEEDCPAQKYPRTFIPRPRPELIATVDDVAQAPVWRTPLLDARAPERYRGEIEPIDPVAGHIPGAVCAAFNENLNADGIFRSPEELRARFMPILGHAPPSQAIVYCGSGVTAAHNLLALEHAGLHGARLYPGSWSEWITDPSRPVKTGNG